jgi:gamma-glutamylcyclotransferase (GGCT)/AIG2-like uncharacterized protein YtfP
LSASDVRILVNCECSFEVMIPLDAAGRDPIFLYGTLTDQHVLTRVLKRVLTESDLAPAWLPDARCVAAAGASYPLLLPALGDAVQGLLIQPASEREIRRLNHFESGEYQAERRIVHLRDGAEREAWLYVGLPHLLASEEPWGLAAWQRNHKAAFLTLCDVWMADCPEPD